MHIAHIPKRQQNSNNTTECRSKNYRKKPRSICSPKNGVFSKKKLLLRRERQHETTTKTSDLYISRILCVHVSWYSVPIVVCIANIPFERNKRAKKSKKEQKQPKTAATNKHIKQPSNYFVCHSIRQSEQKW